MALTEVMRRHPSVHLHHVQQYRWGAESVKPTGLLVYNAPEAMRHLHRFADWSLPKPTFVAIGKTEGGQFCTSGLKEYPHLLCRGMAEIFCIRLWQATRSSDTKVHRVAANSPWHQWFTEMTTVSEEIRAQTWLPDFQG
eukprot:Skav206143  [mRNA]  locus=scaffold471:164247:164663:- [translate_table: standard]